MTVSDPRVIDLVVHNPTTDMVTLILVEEREWGERGALLPDLQAKLSTYLGYALDGQLLEDYPNLRGKRVEFQLRYVHRPGVRERGLLDIVKRQYLDPEGIVWSDQPIEAAT